MQCDTSKKVIRVAELLSVLEGNPKKRIMLATGVLDVLYPHHIKLLDHATENSMLFVGVYTDAQIMRQGGKKPILTDKYRARTVAGFQCVDHVFLLDNLRGVKHILKPDEVVNISPTADCTKAPEGKASTEYKITTIADLASVSGKYRSLQPKKTIVFACGTYDLLHQGHIEYLEAAAMHGDVLCVGVDTDELVLRLKEREVTFSTEKRVRTVAALECVDHVFPFDNFRLVVTELRPDNMVISPVTHESRNAEMAALAGRHGVKIVQLKSTVPITSTSILESIRASDRTSLLP